TGVLDVDEVLLRLRVQRTKRPLAPFRLGAAAGRLGKRSGGGLREPARAGPDLAPGLQIRGDGLTGSRVWQWTTVTDGHDLAGIDDRRIGRNQSRLAEFPQNLVAPAQMLHLAH